MRSATSEPAETAAGSEETCEPGGRRLPPIAIRTGIPSTHDRNQGDRTLQAGVMDHPVEAVLGERIYCSKPVKHPIRRSSFRRNPRTDNDLTGTCPPTPWRDNTQNWVVIQTV
jgi:hypothetical protein